MTETSNKHKHLEFIQTSISRISGNLFLLKGWGITLIAALFALAANDTNKAYILIAYFPLFIFWILDGYFLSHERRFRALYEHVRKLREEDIDFAMDTGAFQTDFQNTWIAAMGSRTLVIYYVGLAVIMLGLAPFIR